MSWWLRPSGLPLWSQRSLLWICGAVFISWRLQRENIVAPLITIGVWFSLVSLSVKELVEGNGWWLSNSWYVCIYISLYCLFSLLHEMKIWPFLPGSCQHRIYLHNCHIKTLWYLVTNINCLTLFFCRRFVAIQRIRCADVLLFNDPPPKHTGVDCADDMKSEANISTIYIGPPSPITERVAWPIRKDTCVMLGNKHTRRRPSRSIAAAPEGSIMSYIRCASEHPLLTCLYSYEKKISIWYLFTCMRYNTADDIR